MTISEIQDLIKFIAKAGVTEVEIEKKDFKITIKSETTKRRSVQGRNDEMMLPQIPMQMPQVAMMPQQPVAAPVPAAAPAPAAAAPAAVDAKESQYITVKSPMIGTFYRKPAPDKPNFVEVGSSVNPGSVLCVIEAMKLFNEIESEVKGKIVKVLVDDNSPVEYDQPLFLVDPS
jgi:acetyl-CoA carboxylase biotin carboxyl carrier protein